MIESIEIRDMYGRLVKVLQPNSSAAVQEFSLGVLSSGSYFVSIAMPIDTIVLRLLKR
ncbi:MAG: T9SS type A sorting domain-containing protein [Bacteroidia bacterium]|nr:T9SS type A sorting domain-containing protein [Bacteroidia bacterium]